MADVVCNIAKGRIVEFYNRVKNNDPAGSALGVIAFASGVVDANIIDADTVAAILSGGAVEATNTNYARAVLTDTELVALPAPDDSNNRYDIAIPQITFTAVVAGDNWTDLLIVYAAVPTDITDPVNANLIPLSLHDFARTPDGSDIVVSAGNFFRAS